MKITVIFSLASTLIFPICCWSASSEAAAIRLEQSVFSMHSGAVLLDGIRLVNDNAQEVALTNLPDHVQKRLVALSQKMIPSVEFRDAQALQVLDFILGLLNERKAPNVKLSEILPSIATESSSAVSGVSVQSQESVSCLLANVSLLEVGVRLGGVLGQKVRLLDSGDFIFVPMINRDSSIAPGWTIGLPAPGTLPR